MKSSVCVDASLIVRALVPGPYTAEALALLSRWQRERVMLIAPALLAFEVTATLRRSVYLNHLSASDGDEAFTEFLQLDIRLSHRRAIFPLAWRLAQELDRPRAYDTAYLALARLRGCDFWTADERLYNAARRRLAWVHWIGDYRREP